jgi:hypothetical protein
MNRIQGSQYQALPEAFRSPAMKPAVNTKNRRTGIPNTLPPQDLNRSAEFGRVGNVLANGFAGLDRVRHAAQNKCL